MASTLLTIAFTFFQSVPQVDPQALALTTHVTTEGGSEPRV